VREDVLDQRSVSVAAARAIYGVVIDRDHLIPSRRRSSAPSGARRTARKARRSSRARSSPASPTTSKCAARPGPCAAPAQKCAADLGPLRDNYKDHCVRRESDISAANPNIGGLQALHRRPAGVPPVLLPGLRRAGRDEIARSEDEVLRDIELELR